MTAGRRLGAPLISVAALLLLASVPALAQSSSASKPGAWEFKATPYLWAAGLDGAVGIGNLPATSVEASFSDLFGLLDMALMAAFEGRRDRWGFFVDALYFDLSDTLPTPDPVFGDATVGLTEQVYSFAGTYRVREGDVAVDVALGARYWDLSTDIELTPGTAPGRTGSGSESWWDGFVGARVYWKPAEHWDVVGYADIGGGGSELQWQVLAGAGYQFNKLVSLDFGYRYLNVDYDQDDFVFDMAMAGPYAGVGFRF